MPQKPKAEWEQSKAASLKPSEKAIRTRTKKADVPPDEAVRQRSQQAEENKTAPETIPEQKPSNSIGEKPCDSAQDKPPQVEPEEENRPHREIIAEKAPGGILPLLYAVDFDSDSWAPSGDSDSIHEVSWGDCMTYIVTGVRGSGKSTNLAALIAHALINEVRVLSNMPVAFRCKYPLNSYGDSKIETLETLPLNMELLLSLNSSIQKALLVLDEIKNWLSNQQWQMPRQKLLNAAINQMRKNRLDLAGSCKDAMKLDPTFRDDELDIVLHCQDMHVFKRSIPRGKHFRVQGWDWSGAWTGWPWFPGKEPDLLLQLTDADRIWHIFDSYQVQDFWEANAKLDPQFENRKIGKNGFVQEQVQTISEEEVQKNLISIMARFNDRILQTDLWRHLGIAPTQNNRETKFAVSQIMDDLGIVTKGHYYVRDYEMVKV